MKKEINFFDKIVMDKHVYTVTGFDNDGLVKLMADERYVQDDRTGQWKKHVLFETQKRVLELIK